MKDNKQPLEVLVSIVLIIDGMDSILLKEYLGTLHKYLNERYTDYEIIIIDQNSKQICSVAEQVDILSSVPSIRWIKLAFSVHIDVALIAGIENAIGDFVLLLRPLIDPISLIEGMIEESVNGCDVIVGVAKEPRSIGYKIVRSVANKVLHSIDYHIPKNSTPVRCLSRRAINTILRTGQIKHQFFIKVANTGYSTKSYSYKLDNIDTLKKRTVMSGIAQSLQLMIFNSTIPLRWISLLGILGSFTAFMFAIYSIAINLLKDDVIEGWTSMVFFTSFLFMILFIILAFLGEYIARLLNENSQQNIYYISSEDTSSVMLEVDRYNVLHQS